MTAEQLDTILILVAVALAGFALVRSYQKGQEVTLTGVVDAVKEARPVAAQLMEIVQIAVNSVEQLRREGKINSNDIAFNHAYDMAKEWIPDEWEVNNEDLINTINAAVLVASTLREQAGASSANENKGQPQ